MQGDQYVCLEPLREGVPRVIFRPNHDILFLDETATLCATRVLAKCYGDQLKYIKHILVQDCGLWHNIDHALTILAPFSCLHVVYVWLDSFRFLPGERLRTRRDYSRAAIELQARDELVLQGKNVVIHYIDLEGSVHGSFQVV